MTNDTALNLYLEQCDRIRLAYGRYRQETETARVCAELIATLTQPEERRRISYRGEVICRVCDVLIMAEQNLRCCGAFLYPLFMVGESDNIPEAFFALPTESVWALLVKRAEKRI